MTKPASGELAPPEADRTRLLRHGLTATDTIERIADLLEVLYRAGAACGEDDLLGSVVYVSLTGASGGMPTRRFATLRAQWPEWVGVMHASEAEVASVVGMKRAGRLRELLKSVAAENERRGVGPSLGEDLTLEFVRAMDDDEAEAVLGALPGFGKRSVGRILSCVLNRSGIGLDPDAERILKRLGLLRAVEWSGSTATGVLDLVRAQRRRGFKMGLAQHGRSVCRPEPDCTSCVLVSFCGEGAARVATDATRPIAIDLFAGAGGLGSGFQQAGFRVALAIEGERHAAQTYRANNPGVPVVERDIAEITADAVRALCPGIAEPDAVIAGPPCQGYSSAGRREPLDEKNELYRYVVSLAEELNARNIVLENVPGLERVNGVGFRDQILAALQQRYSAVVHEVVASDFGVPQKRKRLFFLARRKDLGPPAGPPIATHCEPGQNVDGRVPTRPLRDWLTGPLEVGPGEEAEFRILPDGTTLLNASTMKHSEAVMEKIRNIPQGGGPISYRRLEDDLARTLVAGHRALPVHPWLDRTISVREAARIQGFPDDYAFCGPRAEQPLQVANAVPPPVAAAIAQAVLMTEPGGRTG